jgi:twinkle protein
VSNLPLVPILDRRPGGGSRHIYGKTALQFSYYVGHVAGSDCDVYPIRTPEGDFLGQKIRFPDKSFQIRWAPNVNAKAAGLFGQHLWPNGGKAVYVTEGEIDALSLASAIPSWPVVSIVNGAGSADKELARQIRWLSSFERVYLMFDADERGREAVEACARLFPPGKLHYLTEYGPGCKDINDVLVKRGPEAVARLRFDAKKHKPAGILTGDELWRAACKPVRPGLPWFLPRLNDVTAGLTPGDLYVLCAGTGVGKSQFVGRQVWHNIRNRTATAWMGLEDTPGELVRRVLTHALRQDVYSDQTIRIDQHEELWRNEIEPYLSVVANSWAVDAAEVTAVMRHLILAEGAQWLVLDHLQMITDTFATAEATAMQSRLVNDIALTAKATDCSTLLVVQLVKSVEEMLTREDIEAGMRRRKTAETGARITLSDMKGSAAIKQKGHTIMAFEGNIEAEDDAERRTRLIRCIKGRGKTKPGVLAKIRMDEDTHEYTDVTDVSTPWGDII